MQQETDYKIFAVVHAVFLEEGTQEVSPVHAMNAIGYSRMSVLRKVVALSRFPKSSRISC